MNRRRLSAICIFLSLAVSVSAQDLSKISRPEEAGFSSERLARITQFFQLEVDQGAIPGAVLVVARNGKIVYRQAIGYQDREKKIPMKADAIFRIFSMTRLVASVAVMMLVEEGKIDVMAPVAQYLPEFKEVKVGVEKTGPATGKPTLSLEAPERPMTVQDLLRHTSGLVYGPFGNTLVHQAYNQANLFDPGQTLAEFVVKISKLPLAHQPGTAWEYGMSVDVLGRVVEVVSGMPFDRFLEEKITKPLGMPDTALLERCAGSASRRTAGGSRDGQASPVWSSCGFYQREDQILFGWRRPALHSIRLRALLPDAAQWRRDERRTSALAEDAGRDDIGSSPGGRFARGHARGDAGSISAASTRPELRPGIRRTDRLGARCRVRVVGDAFWAGRCCSSKGSYI
jgi:CubicO group peptidase (beta-lactamase class C family)